MATENENVSQGVKLGRTCLSHTYIPTSEIPEGAGGAVLANAELLWENGKELTYGFIVPWSGSLDEQKKVDEVIKEWELFANIKFLRVEDIKKAMIRISFNPHEFSRSYLGKDNLNYKDAGLPTMNLGWLDPSKKIIDADRGLILHEFGHAIGLQHEQRSPGRGGVITLNEAYIVEAFLHLEGPIKWTEEDVKYQIIDPLKDNAFTNYTALDLNSIMMYFMPAEMNGEGVEIKVNNKLSDYDKAFMLIHYPIFDFEGRTDGWSFGRALDVMGIQGSTKDKVLEKYANGDVPQIRQEFAKYYTSVREARTKALIEEIKLY